MKKVHTSPDSLLIGHLKNILEQNDIACVLMNVYSHGAAGELPPDQVWPQIWVLDDAQFLQARELINQVLRPVNLGGPWRCPHCGEQIEAQFTECWQCGSSRMDENKENI